MVGFWFLEKAPDQKDREKGELGVGEMKKRKKKLFNKRENIKAVFGSCKSISGKYFIFQKCYFPERKMFLCVWLYFKKFSEKYFLVFGKYYKEKTNPENTDKTQIDARCLTGFDGAVFRELQFDDRAVDHDLAKHRVASRDRD